MIDRIRHDIQERLDQLLHEAEKLRRALVALGSRDSGTADSPKPARTKPAGGNRSARPAASPARKAAIKPPETATAKAQPASSSAETPSAPARSPSGATKAAVLKALSSGEAMTAGDVAGATGLGRATVSTTLSKLTKTGEVTKAERGYQLTGPGSSGSEAPSEPVEADKPDQPEPA